MNLEIINLNNVDTLETEEATKMALIMPFIRELGYNVFDNNEVIPEFTADIAKRNGEKVDYAIKIDDKIAFVIEAKHVLENLDKHSKQLSRYFVNTEAKIAILTNGIEYRFFTDLEKDNIMDSEPFFVFNLKNYKKKDLEYLKEFQKESFDENRLYGKAEKSKKIDDIVKVLFAEFTKPSDEFLKHIVDKCYEGTKTKLIIQEYSELLNPALVKFIDVQTAEKLKLAFPEVNIGSLETTVKVDNKKSDAPITTINEITILSYIQLILKNEKEEITLKDNKSYCNILINNKTTKWICRIYDKKELKVIIYSKEREAEITIKTPQDIFNHSEEIKKAFQDRI